MRSTRIPAQNFWSALPAIRISSHTLTFALCVSLVQLIDPSRAASVADVRIEEAWGYNEFFRNIAQAAVVAAADSMPRGVAVSGRPPVDASALFLALAREETPEADRALAALTGFYLGEINASDLAYAITIRGRAIRTALEAESKSASACLGIDPLRMQAIERDSHVECLDANARNNVIAGLIGAIDQGEIIDPGL